MGDLIVIKPQPSVSNADLARAIRALADRVEASPKPVASYGLALVYRDGTIAVEFYGGMLTTLLGAAARLQTEIDREL